MISQYSLRLIAASLLITFFHFSGPGQSVSLPTSHEVYDFLKRLEARGILTEYRDAFKPLSRTEITRHLVSIQPKLQSLTAVERDTYEYFRSEFSYEFGAIGGDPEPTDLRWHLYSLDLTEGVMNLDFNGQFEWLRTPDQNVRVRAQGFRLYGYGFRDVGFLFNFVDYREAGRGIDFAKGNTPDPGFVRTSSKPEALEYNTTEAQLSWQVGEFSFSLEKMHNVWGYGTRGNVIQSRKAPSAPQFRMRVPLTSWLDFVYVLADLHSNVVDSSRSYEAGSSMMRSFPRTVYRSKYMAGHGVEMTIIDGLDLSFGETAIYSDKGIQLMYLIPVMFFKSGEHYNRDTDNIQWFASVDVNLISKTNFYFSVLIDELNTDDLLNPGGARNQLGYTAGIHTYDLPLTNTDFIIEYSRLNPWVYTHKFPSATFTNNGYDMGHWIGQNADLLYLAMAWTPMRELRLGVDYEHYRKGGLKDIAFQYQIPSQSFLYGPLHEERAFGFSAGYQFTRDGFIRGTVRSVSRTDEANPSLDVKGRTEFRVGVSYGIW